MSTPTERYIESPSFTEDSREWLTLDADRDRLAPSLMSRLVTEAMWTDGGPAEMADAAIDFLELADDLTPGTRQMIEDAYTASPEFVTAVDDHERPDAA